MVSFLNTLPQLKNFAGRSSGVSFANCLTLRLVVWVLRQLRAATSGSHLYCHPRLPVVHPFSWVSLTWSTIFESGRWPLCGVFM